MTARAIMQRKPENGRKRPKQTTTYKRRRERPKQIYLSDAEHEALERMRERRGLSASELVREWLIRAQTAHEARERARQRENAPPPTDPRQTRIEETYE